VVLFASLAVVMLVAGLMRLGKPGDRLTFRRLWWALTTAWAVSMVIAAVWWIVTGDLHPAWYALLSLFGLGEIVIWIGDAVAGRAQN
jgi:hypothetical protein